LRPTAQARTTTETYRLAIEQEEHRLRWQQDPHGDHIARVHFSADRRSQRHGDRVFG
jgi:hypothetical protein